MQLIEILTFFLSAGLNENLQWVTQQSNNLTSSAQVKTDFIVASSSTANY